MTFLGYHLNRNCLGSVWMVRFGAMTRLVCRCQWLTIDDYVMVPGWSYAVQALPSFVSGMVQTVPRSERSPS